MAITNAQQYKQLVNPPLDGKRPGYRGDAAYRSRSAQSSPSAGGQGNVGTQASFGGSDRDSSQSTVYGPTRPSDEPPSSKIRKEQKEKYEKQFYDKGKVPPLGSRPTSLGTRIDQRNKQKKLDYINRLISNKRKKIVDAIELAGIEGVTEENFDELYNKGMLNIPSVQDLVEEGFYKSDGPFATGEKIPGITSLRPPGFTGLLTKPFESPLTTEGIDKILQETMDLENLRTTEGLEGTSFNELMKTYEPNRFKLQNPEPGGRDDTPMDPCKGPNPPAYCFVNQDPTEPETPKRNLGGLAPRFAGSIFDFTGLADGGRAGMMDGGMMDDDPTGGIMDLETGRQMYFLGKLVKKATRAVKKIAKSPIGKAALAFGAYKLGGGFLKNKGIMGSLFGQAGSRVGEAFVPYKEGFFTKLGLTKGGGSLMPTLKGGLTLGFGIPMALDLLGVGKDDDKKMDLAEYYKTQGIDIDAIRNSPYRYLTPATTGSKFNFADGGRTGYQEGGDAEPVAKKTMPLIDMDGKEKDYRETGGFVDMGRMERADDVPARLSKNEFVFTADAVRNAGEGDIDKGAEVMYNMMKNLEAGGEVSEESQGLEGARKMFQTSQRLEEVL